MFLPTFIICFIFKLRFPRGKSIRYIYIYVCVRVCAYTYICRLPLMSHLKGEGWGLDKGGTSLDERKGLIYGEKGREEGLLRGRGISYQCSSSIRDQLWQTILRLGRVSFYRIRLYTWCMRDVYWVCV